MSSSLLIGLVLHDPSEGCGIGSTLMRRKLYIYIYITFIWGLKDYVWQNFRNESNFLYLFAIDKSFCSPSPLPVEWYPAYMMWLKWQSMWLVWFRIFCVYFFLIICGREDKAIILRNAPANGPIVPSLDDWWFWIQHAYNDKLQCKIEVVEGKPTPALLVHHKSHLKYIRTTWVYVTEAGRFVHRTAVPICCMVSMTGRRRMIDSKFV
jgi:hypothetical protein